MRLIIRDSIGVIVLLIICIPWLIGIVLSKGFWSCLFALCVPPYAWYLAVEKIMLVNGWIQ